MKNKTIIITGANSGIGKALSAECADLGYHVVMVCRNKSRGKEAFDELITHSKRSLDLMICDLNQEESIRAFASAFKAKYNTLDVLVNNAGLISKKQPIGEVGFDVAFKTNFLGHFLLTHLLFPMINRDHGKIINVTSLAHVLGSVRRPLKRRSAFFSYARSKHALVLFTNVLAKEINHTKIRVCAIHPGIVASNIVKSRVSVKGTTATTLFERLFPPSAVAAKRMVALIESEFIQGGYYHGKKNIKPLFSQKSSKKANELFELALSYYGLPGFTVQ